MKREFCKNGVVKVVGRVFILIMSLFLANTSAHSQNISNEGTEFWAVFPTHVPSQPTNLASIKIYITSKTGSSGTVSCGGQSLPFTVGANGLASLIVPRPAAYIESSQSNSVIPNKAIHIQVNTGEGKIAVYSHIFAGTRSAASLILPVASLGQKYHSMNYRQDPVGHNFLVLAATEPNTELRLKHSRFFRVSYNFTSSPEIRQPLLTQT